MLNDGIKLNCDKEIPIERSYDIKMIKINCGLLKKLDSIVKLWL